jgi:hypothetical protein
VAVAALPVGRARGVESAAALSGGSEPAAPFDLVARLQQQLTERDEIIVALQHVVRSLHHEIENRRVEVAYAAFARSSTLDRQTARERVPLAAAQANDGAA